MHMNAPNINSLVLMYAFANMRSIREERDLASQVVELRSYCTLITPVLRIDHAIMACISS